MTSIIDLGLKFCGTSAQVRFFLKSRCQVQASWLVMVKVSGKIENVQSLVLSGMGMNVKKVLYEKVVVPTVMYGSHGVWK